MRARVCVSVQQLSSSHMNKTRHHSLGSTTFTTVSNSECTHQPSPITSVCNLWCHTHTHTHRVLQIDITFPSPFLWPYHKYYLTQIQNGTSKHSVSKDLQTVSARTKCLPRTAVFPQTTVPTSLATPGTNTQTVLLCIHRPTLGPQLLASELYERRKSPK